MKTKLPVIAIIALLVSACGTGTYTTRAYDDDIYFSPKDAPPVLLSDEATSKNRPQETDFSENEQQDLIVSQIKTNRDGTKTLQNNILKSGKTPGSNQIYDIGEQQIVDSDTTAYMNDNEVKYVINNYYDGDEFDYADRINMFHRPYFYSPYYSLRYDWPYMYNSYRFDYYWNWGPSYYYDPFYGSYYGSNFGWYDPWYWDYSFGLMWWDPFYYNTYSNLYHWYDTSPYVSGSWGLFAPYNVERRRDTNMTLERSRPNSTNEMKGERASVRGNSGTTTASDRVRSVADSENKNATIVNDRRSAVSSEGRRAINSTETRTTNTFVRPASENRASVGSTETSRRSSVSSSGGRSVSDGQSVRSSQGYTPSYSRPRVVNQSNYNNSNSYSRSRSVSNGSVSTGRSQSVSTPQSSSSMRQTFNSSSTYSTTPSYSPRSSSYQGSGNSTRSVGGNSGGSSTSTPSFSSGGGSSSGGGGGSYSGGSSGGGGGGSSSRR